MGTHIYLHIDDESPLMNGDVVLRGGKKWKEFESFSLVKLSFQSKVGKEVHNTTGGIRIVRRNDDSSARWAQASSHGDDLGTVSIEVVRGEGSKEEITFRMTVNDAVVSNFWLSSSGNATNAVETVELDFSSFIMFDPPPASDTFQEADRESGWDLR
jgi:type VI protein secretion system component Hcp